jgi:hypothetical protein
MSPNGGREAPISNRGWSGTALIRVIHLLSDPPGKIFSGGARTGRIIIIMVWSPQVRRVSREGGGECFVVGHRLVDEFLEFAASRARPNTVRPYAHDLKTFFSVVGQDPVEVRPADVMGFVIAQRRPRLGTERVVQTSYGGSGLSTATIRRRLAAVSVFYGYLITRGDVEVETVRFHSGMSQLS